MSDLPKLIAPLLLLAAPAWAEPYVLLQGAQLSCDQVSNHNHIECDSQPGYELAIEGGYIVPVVNGLEVWVGAQAFHHWQKQHGWNEGRGKDDDQQSTADGETIRITGLRGAVTGVGALWGPFSIYGGVGVGPAAFDTTRATKLVGVGQIKGGLQVEWKSMLLRAGYQAWGTTKTSTGDGVPNWLTGHGIALEAGWRF